MRTLFGLMFLSFSMAYGLEIGAAIVSLLAQGDVKGTTEHVRAAVLFWIALQVTKP